MGPLLCVPTVNTLDALPRRMVCTVGSPRRGARQQPRGATALGDGTWTSSWSGSDWARSASCWAWSCSDGWRRRSQRAAARVSAPDDAARHRALAAERHGTGQAFLYAGGAMLLATVAGLVGSLDDRTGAFLVTTTATVAAVGILLAGYLQRIRNPVPARRRTRSAPVASASIVMAPPPADTPSLSRGRTSIGRRSRAGGERRAGTAYRGSPRERLRRGSDHRRGEGCRWPLAAAARSHPARPILVHWAIHPSPRKRPTPGAGSPPITRQATGATTRILRRQKMQRTPDTVAPVDTRDRVVTFPAGRRRSVIGTLVIRPHGAPWGPRQTAS